MKLSKTTVIALAAAGLLSMIPAGNAQNETNKPPVVRPGGGPGAVRGFETRLNDFSEKLKLTEDQKPKFKTILEEQNKKRAEFRNLSQEERRAKMQALNEESSRKLKEILTPEQFTKYEELMKQQRANRPGPASTAAEAAHDHAQDGGTHKEKAEKPEKK